MLRHQNWVKLKLVAIIHSDNRATGISPGPCLPISLHLCVVKVVCFSNEVRLKGKVFEVVNFCLACFMFICDLGFYSMQMIW